MPFRNETQARYIGYRGQRARAVVAVGGGAAAAAARVLAAALVARHAAGAARATAAQVPMLINRLNVNTKQLYYTASLFIYLAAIFAFCVNKSCILVKTFV